MEQSVKDRFFAKIKTGGEDECWEWTGAKCKGYGIFRGRGTMYRAPRLMWELHNGPIPDGLFVLHNCHTPSCVNPTHLRLGTQQQNIQDTVRMGRAGSIGFLPRVDERMARRIIGHINIGRSDSNISKQLNVKVNTVRKIREGKIFTHISERLLHADYTNFAHLRINQRK